MPIEPWFSTPLFVYDFNNDRLESIQHEINSAMPEIKKIKGNSPWGDNVKTTFLKTGCNDLITFNLTALQKEINWALVEYCREIRYPDPDFQLVESWVNFLDKGEFQYDHTHPNCRVSGIYYYASNGDDGDIRFQNPNALMQFNGFPSDRIARDGITYKPKVGRLILFPSWLIHRVNINNTDHQRISIAFNFQ
jgi:uncharacterized protein (TIGR02466 family)